MYFTINNNSSILYTNTTFKIGSLKMAYDYERDLVKTTAVEIRFGTKETYEQGLLWQLVWHTIVIIS